jgi:hypothetical protein
MRVYMRLVAATKGTRAVSGNKSYALMPSDLPAVGLSGEEVEHTLLRVTGPDRNAADAVELRENTDAVLAYLDDPASSAAFLSRHRKAMSGEVLAALYGALSDDIEDTEEAEALLATAADEERIIGEAFTQALLQNLPSSLADPAAVAFAGAQRLPKEALRLLFQDVSVACGGPAAARLAVYGVTPVSVAAAAQAVANAAQRQCRRNGVEPGGYIVLGQLASGWDSPVLERAEAVREVIATTELPEETAERLSDWLLGVAEYVPGIFPGFETGLYGGELRLTLTDMSEEDPFVHWGPAQHSAAALTPAAWDAIG